MAKFYEFTQNNSGGSFYVDDKVCHRLFIEAEHEAWANKKAEDLGMYFDGEGDSPCCGNRWDKAYDFVNLEGFQKDGYEVNVYDYYSNPEDRWEQKYGHYNVIIEPHWKEEYGFRSYVGKISFKDIEEYAQFLADEYGLTTPDTRIYYTDGRVVEINKRK